MTLSPLVSVIVPTFNRWPQLQGTIDSVVAQTYRPLELIVVDDGSTDETPRLCAEYLASIDLPARYDRQSNAGAPAARNRGLALSKGSYLQFLDSDDLLLPRKIAEQVAQLNLNAQSQAVACCPWIRRRIDASGSQTDSSFDTGLISSRWSDALQRHLAGWFLPPHAYLWPRHLVEDIGGWDERLTADQDGDFAMRALLTKPVIVTTEKPGVVYVQHPGARVSADESEDRLRSRLAVADKLRQALRDQSRLEQFSLSLAARYFLIARLAAPVSSTLSKECLRACHALSPGYFPAELGWKYRLIYTLVGLVMAERLNRWKQRWSDDPV